MSASVASGAGCFTALTGNGNQAGCTRCSGPAPAAAANGWNMSERLVALDFETTGVDAKSAGVVEVGAVEILDRQVTGATFHRLVNPLGAIPWQATKIHGLRDSDVRDAPTFRQIVPDLQAFCRGARLVAHSAPYDRNVLNAQLAKCGYQSTAEDRWICTLAMYRRLYPKHKHSLDAACSELGIKLPPVPRGGRGRHSALYDAQLTAWAWVMMTRRQEEMELQQALPLAVTPARQRPVPLEPRLTDADIDHHAAYWREKLGPKALWFQQQEEAVA